MKGCRSPPVQDTRSAVNRCVALCLHLRTNSHEVQRSSLIRSMPPCILDTPSLEHGGYAPPPPAPGGGGGVGVVQETPTSHTAQSENMVFAGHRRSVRLFVERVLAQDAKHCTRQGGCKECLVPLNYHFTQ